MMKIQTPYHLGPMRLGSQTHHESYEMIHPAKRPKGNHGFRSNEFLRGHLSKSANTSEFCIPEIGDADEAPGSGTMDDNRTETVPPDASSHRSKCTVPGLV